MIEIYKASAGSGKTFTLTREYIKFILGYKDEEGRYHLNKGSRAGHRTVLAITFTNKATEEMKSRIIHELAVIAGAEPGWNERSPYEKYLCGVFSCTPEALAEVARKELKELLFDFDKFNVSTIDAFFQTVLRAFAREADVSGNYEVELEDKPVIEAGIDRMLQDLNRLPDVSNSRFLLEWLTKYMIKLIEEGKSFNIFNRASKVNSNLVDFIKNITDDTFKAHSEEILEYLKDKSKYIAFIEAVHSRMEGIRKEVVSACRPVLELIERSPSVQGIINSYVFNPVKAWGLKGYGTEPSATLRKAMAEISDAYVKKGKTSPLRTPELDEKLSRALSAIEGGFRDLTYMKILTANLYQLGLLGNIMDYVEKYRKENSAILLSDTNSILAKIIGEEDAPFLYEKIGNTYRHFLIDEFQDTSHSQWQNIRPLLSESLASDNDNLIIGDEKQCIYRFRNSDPSLLKNLHKDKVAVGRSGIRGDKLSENTNWRSSREVVRFNNTLFSAISRQLGFVDTYANVVQQISPKHLDHQGYVRVNVYPESRDTDSVDRALETLTVNLRRQLESGYKPGEIAVLVRRWKDGDVVISHLEKVRQEDPTFPPFNIVSDRSLLISRSKSVLFIVSNLRFLAQTGFKHDRHKRSHKEVTRMLSEFEAGISRQLSPSEALAAAIENLDKTDIKREKDHFSLEGVDLMTLVETIIAELPEDTREEDTIYLTAFQDVVTDFMAKGRADIRSFLEWWDEHGVKLSVSGAKDDRALNILTVHKSKGLEYRCVHIPFASFKVDSFTDTEWFQIDGIDGIDPEIIPPFIPLNVASPMKYTPLAGEYERISSENQLDRLNLLYVAFTRAIDELIIGVAVPSEVKNKSEEATYSISPARFIYRALKSCDPGFVSALESEYEIEGGASNTPFISFTPDEGGVVEIGHPTKAVKAEIEKKSAISPSDTRIMSSYPITENKSIWENTKLDKSNFAKILTARERGLIIHDVLSRVVTSRDVEGALNILRVLPATIGADEKEKLQIRDIVRRRVSDPLVKDWFDGFKRVLIEREVVTESGETKRFDRVVWTAGGEIHLIDYKSGNQSPDKYRKQIKGYIDFFHSMGYPCVRGFLYYLDTGKVIEI